MEYKISNIYNIKKNYQKIIFCPRCHEEIIIQKESLQKDNKRLVGVEVYCSDELVATAYLNSYKEKRKGSEYNYNCKGHKDLLNWINWFKKNYNIK